LTGADRSPDIAEAAAQKEGRAIRPASFILAMLKRRKPSSAAAVREPP
jgi:hypothetical protein